MARVRAKLDRNEDPDPVEREVLDLYDLLITYQGVMSGESLHIVPHADDPKAAWYSIADLATPQTAAIPQVQRVRALVSAIVMAYRDGDRPAVQTAASALGSRLAELAPGVYPARRDLAREVHYNGLKPFRTAWLLYLFGFLALLASFPLASRAFSWAGMALVVAGFLSQAYGMTLRVMISGRPPVTNMYESVVWVAFGGVLFALVFEAVYKVRIFAACASALAVICLILADNVPILDGSISPLVPVLRDNMWLTVHVLTITLGYAAFTLAMGIGHLNLGLYFFRPGEAALFKNLSLFLYRALQVGHALPRGRHHAGRRVGLVLVGPLLGLGPEGDLGPHRPPRLPGDPPRPHDRLDQGLRDGGGLAPRLPAGADGLVRGQLRARHRPALLRLRLRRLLVRRRLRGLRGAGDRGGAPAPPFRAAEAGAALPRPGARD